MSRSAGPCSTIDDEEDDYRDAVVRSNTGHNLSRRGASGRHVPVPMDRLLRVLQCFGLEGVDDRRPFDKEDMQRRGTTRQLQAMVGELEEHYTPCKARTYLYEPMDESRAITVLKQLLRSHGIVLFSRERNVAGRKITYYNLTPDAEAPPLRHMVKKEEGPVRIVFD